MGLRFDPVGGGQFKQAAQQLIDIENQSLKPFNARKAKEEARLKLFGEFKSKFNALQKSVLEIATPRNLLEYKVDLGDGSSLASASIDKEKIHPGQYSIQVDTLATRGSLLSSGLSDPAENLLGDGIILITTDDGSSLELSIPAEQSSLNSIAQLINQDASSPVRASVIKDQTETEAPWRLILSGKKEGSQNKIDTIQLEFLDSTSDFRIEEEKEAKNALISIDGLPIELESNEIKDLVPGLNLQLKQARPEQPFTLSVTQDTPKISAKIKPIIENLNQILQFIVKQNTIDEKSDTSVTFAGDTSLQNLEYRLRNLIHGQFIVSGSSGSEPKIIRVSDLGIQFDKTGSINFNEDKLNQELEKNYATVSEFLSGPTGFAATLKELVNGYNQGVTGILSIKEKGIRDRIKDIDDQIERKERAIEQKKAEITGRFSRLEGTLANLQKQQQYLSSSLPGAGGGNMISQLLG
ncbi:MAG: flagellar filament capping protein FliD [Bdellovibrionia bacterium]